MPIKVTKLGPGTLTFGPTGTPELDVSCQIVSGGVNHEYEDVSDAVTTLCGNSIGAVSRRNDSLQFTTLADLTAGGMYEYLYDNDLTTVAFEYTPNTAGGAKWAGEIVVHLPDSVSGDEYGANLGGDITLPGVGTFTFTAETAGP